MSAEIGFIYILSSPMYEACFKVGCSTIDPIERARQLSASSGVAYPFTVAYQRKLEFPFQVEAAIHRMLDQYRLNDSREFFRLKLHKIIELVETYEEVRNEFWAPELDLPYSELFATFSDNGSARELTVKEREEIRLLEQKIERRTSGIIE